MYEHVSCTSPNRETPQIFKHKEEKSRLHTAMQAAAHDASKELQSKDKRIQQMEKKVGYPRRYELVNFDSNIHYRFNCCEMNEPPRPGNFLKRSSTSVD